MKSIKCLLRSSTSPSGSFGTYRFLCAIMQIHNTPDLDCNISPVQIIFGWPIRSAFVFPNRCAKFSSQYIWPLRGEAWLQTESAMKKRFHHYVEYSKKRPKQPLYPKPCLQIPTGMGSLWQGCGELWLSQPHYQSRQIRQSPVNHLHFPHLLHHHLGC